MPKRSTHTIGRTTKKVQQQRQADRFRRDNEADEVHSQGHENDSEETVTHRLTQRRESERQRREHESTEDKTVRLNRRRNAREVRRFQSSYTIALQSHENIDEDSVQEHYCGLLNFRWLKCKSKNFLDEKSSTDNFVQCCHNGKVILDSLPVSQQIKNLLIGDNGNAKNFQDNVRQYNCALAFASMGGHIVPPPGQGPYCFRIHGQLYHRGGPLHPLPGQIPKYAQLYILDAALAQTHRMNILENVGCLPSLMGSLADHISEINPLARAYRMLREVEIEEEEMARANGREITPVMLSIINDRADDQRRYNAAQVNEIAMVFKTVDGAPPFERDIRIYNRSDHQTEKISILHDKLDPMTYPILFPYGTSGWTTNMKGNTFGKRGNISQLQYYSYRMAIRDEFNPIWNAGKLTQQFCVDSYCKIEANRLNYIEQNQKNLRADKYKSVMDHIANRANNEGIKAGKAVILPSSFQGSPRNMQQNYQDAMAIVTKHGKPDLFCTMTYNPKWKEITENLRQVDDNGVEYFHKAEHRPDLVARVFKLKLKELLDDISKKLVFGGIVAKIYVIEFQKRGLPHAHILIILTAANKPRSTELIDKIVSAEIPDPNTHSRLCQIVIQHTIHGPCGNANTESPCMIQGKCKKDFPKAECEETNADINGYPKYRRRKLRLDQVGIYKSGIHAVDNQWVVPYNPYLSLKYNCHINMEVCASIKSVKYLFKYVYKGHDCANVELIEKYSNKKNGEVTWNELKSHVDSRYVSAPEAMWRILEFKMHEQSHAIIRLAIHLPNEQIVYFEEGLEGEAAANASERDDTLTAWFNLNAADTTAGQYLYTQIPECYVFNSSDRQWKPRKKINKPLIGRMYAISIQQQELYYLRLLLLHVRGAQSYEHLRSVHGTICSTFKEAAIQMRLLDDDTEYDACLSDAAISQMPSQLRELFAYICVFGVPQNAMKFWETHKYNLTEDLLHRHPGMPPDIAHQHALSDIQQTLVQNGKALVDFELPTIDSSLPQLNPIENTNWTEEIEESARMSGLLNPLQREAFDNIMRAVSDDNYHERCFFIDGPGGSGKTFIYETLYDTLTGVNLSVKCVASTGIAATLLPFGRTAHSSFGFPVPFLETSTSNIRGNSNGANILKHAKLIVWDEVTMTPHLQLREVERLLRELLNNNKPFGGKVMVLGGDFRQCLPVVKHGNKVKTLQECVNNGKLWEKFKHLKLSTNMRLNSIEPGQTEWQNWQLRLGNGELLNENGFDNDIVEIPTDCIEHGDLIDSIFGKNLSSDRTHEFSSRAILCPKNDSVRDINEQILDRLDGEFTEYCSADSLDSQDPDETANFPVEFLNSLIPSGLPKHRMRLKVGAIVMLLRNFLPSKGLCNGTRLIVRKTMPNVLLAEILSGKAKGNQVFIPRIIMQSQSGEYPFILRRRQFPVALAFAMTINKSQGQSFDMTGIYLREPVFGHGQLYVAFSRGKSKQGMRVKVVHIENVQGNLIPGSHKLFTRNCVFKEVFGEHHYVNSETAADVVPMQLANIHSDMENEEIIQDFDMVEARGSDKLIFLNGFAETKQIDE